MVRPLLTLAARDNHVVSALITTGTVTFSWCAPWANRFTTLTSFTFTTTMWVINRVHGYTTYTWTHTTPAVGTGLTDLTQAVFVVADLTNSGTAIYMYTTYFART